MSATRADPFRERRRARSRVHHVLGLPVRFESESAALLALADSAFGALPRRRVAARAGHVKSRRQAAPFVIRLVLVADGAPQEQAVTLAAGGGWLCGATAGAGFALMDPARRAAFVGIPRALLRDGYTARYELLEFATLTLLARAQPLVPLHAAAVVLGDRCALLLGDRGAGKSTLCLHAMLAGLRLLSEDSVFVSADARLAAGVPGFLHLRLDATRWVRGTRHAATLARAARIRRRSGVRKLELDLRRSGLPLAASPVRLAAVIALGLSDRGTAPLRALRPRELRALLAADQPYAASRPEWRRFERAVARIPAYALSRALAPPEAIRTLRAVLEDVPG